MGAQSCKRGNNLASRKSGHAEGCPFQHIFQALSGGVDCLLVPHIHSGRAYQQIAVYGGRHKNAFTVCSRELENGSVHEIAHLFIHQTVFALSGDDMNLICAHHIMEETRVNACGVDNQFRGEIPLAGADAIACFFFLNVCYFGI